jgi:acyl dehydratase
VPEGNEPHITEQMRSAIGVESAPEVIEIDRTVVRRVVEMLADDDPLWSDNQFAASTPLGGIVAFPIALHPSMRSVNLQGQFDNPFTGGSVPSGDEWEFFEPIRPGDTLTVTGKIADFSESEGRRRMLFITSEYSYRNQHGRVAMIARRTTVHFAPRSKG